VHCGAAAPRSSQVTTRPPRARCACRTAVTGRWMTLQQLDQQISARQVAKQGLDRELAQLQGQLAAAAAAQEQQAMKTTAASLNPAGNDAKLPAEQLPASHAATAEGPPQPRQPQQEGQEQQEARAPTASVAQAPTQHEEQASPQQDDRHQQLPQKPSEPPPPQQEQHDKVQHPDNSPPAPVASRTRRASLATATRPSLSGVSCSRSAHASSRLLRQREEKGGQEADSGQARAAGGVRGCSQRQPPAAAAQQAGPARDAPAATAAGADRRAALHADSTKPAASKQKVVAAASASMGPGRKAAGVDQRGDASPASSGSKARGRSRRRLGTEPGKGRKHCRRTIVCLGAATCGRTACPCPRPWCLPAAGVAGTSDLLPSITEAAEEQGVGGCEPQAKRYRKRQMRPAVLRLAADMPGMPSGIVGADRTPGQRRRVCSCLLQAQGQGC
jgi:hypothetical protein